MAADAELLRKLQISDLELSPNRKRRPRKSRGRFIKGPIPWGWITTAATLPGKSLHIALGLWYVTGLKKSRSVVLSRSVLQHLGLGARATRNGLRRLEMAGLIEVDRSNGRSPRVTVLDGK
jgi:hypothetical protein